MNSESIRASLLALRLFKIVTMISITKATARRVTSKKVATTAPLLSQNCLEEEVTFDDEVSLAGGSTDVTMVVDVEGSSSPILKVLLGVTSSIEEYEVVADKVGVEVVDEVIVVVVGVVI